MKTKIITRLLAFIIILTAGFTNASAQAEFQKLTATILHLDSAFWNAYNSCDSAHFKDFVSDDVEFYHDKGGITMGAKALIESLNKNICGNAEQRVRREAVSGTVKVYPMQNGNEVYGALISGEHKFYVTQKGKPEFQTGIADFTQLWQVKNGVWKMTRILSYNHHEPEYINSRKEVALTVRELDQLTGTYKSNQIGQVIAIRENNILILKAGGQTHRLYPMSATSFFLKERDVVFEFEKDATGKPVKLIIKDHGNLADELMFEK